MLPVGQIVKQKQYSSSEYWNISQLSSLHFHKHASLNVRKHCDCSV